MNTMTNEAPPRDLLSHPAFLGLHAWVGARAVRGWQLLEQGAVHDLGDGCYLVESSHEPGRYYVVHPDLGCSCPDSTRAPVDERGVRWCKHFCAVYLLRAEVPT